MDQPQLPENYFVRVDDFLGIPQISLMRTRKFWFAERVMTLYMDDVSQDEIFNYTQELIEFLEEDKRLKSAIAAYSGDYHKF